MLFDSKNRKRMNTVMTVVMLLVVVSMILLYIPSLLG